MKGMLPRPIPLPFLGLPPEERAGRGRAAVRLWLLGCTPRVAWGFAMTKNKGWESHLPHRYEGRLVDRLLPGEYMRRRLADARDALGGDA